MRLQYLFTRIPVQYRYFESPANKVYGSISEAKSRATLMRPKTERRSQLNFALTLKSDKGLIKTADGSLFKEKCSEFHIT